ncbi:hypothetical protein ACFQX7_36655 [Luedemannella flava]
MNSTLTSAYAEALFNSELPTGSTPTRAEAATAIRRAIAEFGGVRACASVMASEYGDHPETAIRRMRWALAVAESHVPTPARYAIRCARSRAHHHHRHHRTYVPLHSS